MDPEFVNVLIFDVGGQRHGVPAADVRELLPALTVTPLPDAAAGVEGVINLRGMIVPVLSVRHRFGLPARDVALSDHFIVIHHRDTLTALHVDQAVELARLDAAAIAEVNTEPSEHVTGAGELREKRPRVAKYCGGMVLLHPAHDLVASVAVRTLAGRSAPDAGGEESP